MRALHLAPLLVAACVDLTPPGGLARSGGLAPGSPVEGGIGVQVDASGPGSPVLDRDAGTPETATDVGVSGRDVAASPDAPGDSPAMPDAPPAMRDAPPSLDAPGSQDVPSAPDMPAAGKVDALPATCKTFWQTTFDRDPTRFDGNDDGVPDWLARDGKAFNPAQIVEGGWVPSTDNFVILDSRPLHPFDGPVSVEVRFQSLGVPRDYGAIFWINVGQSGAAFRAVFASLGRVVGGGQKLTINGKPSMYESVALATFLNLPDRPVTLRLDIDPQTGAVEATIDGERRTRVTAPRTASPNNDRFFTVHTWDGSNGGRFEYVSVRACP